MTYIVKKQEQPVPKTNPAPLNPDRFELFTTEVMKDVNDKNVTIPRSLGFFTLENLTNDKKELQKRMDDIQEKIDTIQALIDSEK